MAGDRETAHKLEVELQQSSDAQAPNWLGELGWWHYLRGDYQKSVDLLSAALQQRPGNARLGLQLSWALLEVRRYGDTLQTLADSSDESGTGSEQAMIRAVAHWLAQDRDQALSDYNNALARQPEWKNSRWVKALYSPLVAQCIQEMQSERERRKHKADVAVSPAVDSTG
jgi:tetratricopeptide (TPR) repeat protein